MLVVINDTAAGEQLIAQRKAMEIDRHDEVWEGVYFVSPDPNLDHQWIVTELSWAVREVIDVGRGDRVYAGANVSDREEDWTSNYRVPDVVVVLAGGAARAHRAHLQGGPDFLVEVISPNDRSREKLDFYSALGVRELLVVDREPWALELYRLDAGALRSVRRSTVAESDVLASAVLPLNFRLVEGSERPEIEVRSTRDDRSWTV